MLILTSTTMITRATRELALVGGKRPTTRPRTKMAGALRGDGHMAQTKNSSLTRRGPGKGGHPKIRLPLSLASSSATRKKLIGRALKRPRSNS